MSSILDILANRTLLCALSGWFLAQALKVPTYYIVEKKWDFRRFLGGSGGMPSSHTAMVVAMALSVGAQEGFASAAFTLAFCLASIVMYDAMGVRRETGKQGEVINEILGKVLVDGKQISDAELKELVGHSPFEVLGGTLVGVLCAVLWIFVF